LAYKDVLDDEHFASRPVGPERRTRLLGKCGDPPPILVGERSQLHLRHLDARHEEGRRRRPIAEHLPPHCIVFANPGNVTKLNVLSRALHGASAPELVN
jgi:hypothetical protein